MWLSYRISLLLIASFLSSAQSSLAQRTVLKPVQNNVRDLSDLLGGSELGNLTGTFDDLIGEATSLVTSFIAVIQEFNDATNENDLVKLLGLDLNNDADDDTKPVTNNTVGTAGRNATCPGMAVLFARGTAETGNVGLFVGPSFFTALRNYINGTTTLAIQGVPYPASVQGFLAGGSSFGSGLMALMVNRTVAACPNTKIVLSGYSQGAQVVHNAMQLINNGSFSTGVNGTVRPYASSAAAIDSRVISVVLFGDPRNGIPVSGTQTARLLSLCHAQDDICQRGGDIITLDHLTYNQDAAQAAMFVMQKSGLGVASRDAMNQGMGNVPTVRSTAKTNMGAQIGTGAGLPGFGFLSGNGFK